MTSSPHNQIIRESSRGTDSRIVDRDITREQKLHRDTVRRVIGGWPSSTRNDPPEEMKRSVYSTYHQDGLLDIAVALMMLVMAFHMAGAPGGISHFAWVPLLLIWLAKKLITSPRTGCKELGPAQLQSGKEAMLTIISALFLTGVVGILLFLLYPLVRIVPVWEFYFGEYCRLVMGAIFAFLLAVVGSVCDLNQFYIYAALTFGVLTVGQVYTLPLYELVGLLAVLMLISGGSILIWFLRKSPGAREKIPTRDL